MRLYEYEAKKLFASMGLAVPKSYGVVSSVADLEGLELDFPVMVKAMVLTGGRGKSGGIRKVKDRAAATAAVRELLGLTIKGYPVQSLLLEQVAPEAGACYLGVTTHPATYDVVAMASASGGVDIEQVAVENPDAILKLDVPGNERELPASLAREFGEFLSERLGRGRALAPVLGDAMAKLYAAFQKFDCKVAEVNPLLVTPDGRAICADAKVVVDDNALYRQTAIFELLGLSEARHDVSELTRDEQRARDAGFKYVDLLPEQAPKDPERLYVGLVPGGAGYGIFSIDEVANIGERHFGGKVVPVNFMDSGGGPTVAGVAAMFDLLMDKSIVDLIITSRFGGISSCDVFIQGLVRCLRERHGQGRRMVPVHGRMVGTDLPTAREFLAKAKTETPDALAGLDMAVGNEQIMADVIRQGIAKAFERRQGAQAAH
jgi:succinyl-CoA synthetase beta subunit